MVSLKWTKLPARNYLLIELPDLSENLTRVQFRLIKHMATESKSLEVDKSQHAYIAQLSKHVGNEVVLKGWLYNLRSSGKTIVSAVTGRNWRRSMRGAEEGSFT